MAKNDYAHSIRMVESLRKNVGTEAAVEFEETFASLEYISEHKILFCYPQCYCSCVKRVPQGLPKTWCYCTLGNAEGIFRNVFKQDVKVSLCESIKSGSNKCVIEVEWE